MSTGYYTDVLQVHAANQRNRLYSKLFALGQCSTPLDTPAVMQQQFCVEKFIAQKSPKPDHLVTARRQVEQLIESVYMLSPGLPPASVVGTPHDWFLFLKLPVLTTAVVVYKALMANEDAARDGDYRHLAANMLWGQLYQFASVRAKFLDLQASSVSTVGYPADVQQGHHAQQFAPAQPIPRQQFQFRQNQQQQQQQHHSLQQYLQSVNPGPPVQFSGQPPQFSVRPVASSPPPPAAEYQRKKPVKNGKPPAQYDRDREQPDE